MTELEMRGSRVLRPLDFQIHVPQAEEQRTGGDFFGRSVGQRGEGPLRINPAQTDGVREGGVPWQRGVRPGDGRDAEAMSLGSRQPDAVARTAMRLVNEVELLKARAPEEHARLKECLDAVGMALAILPQSPPGLASEAIDHMNQLSALRDMLGELGGGLEAMTLAGPARHAAARVAALVETVRQAVEERMDELGLLNPPQPMVGATEDVLQAINSLISDVENLKADSPELHSAFKALLDPIAEARGNLFIAFGDQAAIVEHSERLGEMVQRLQRDLPELQRIADNSDRSTEIGQRTHRMAHAIQRLYQRSVDDMKGLLAQASDSILNNPTSEKAVFHSKSFTTEGAGKIVESEIAKLRGRVDLDAIAARRVLETAKQFLQFRHESLLQRDGLRQLSGEELSALMGSPGPDKGIKTVPDEVSTAIASNDFRTEWPVLPLSHPQIREDGMMQLYLERVFAEAGLEPPHDWRETLLEARLGAINRQPWPEVRKEVALNSGAVTTTVGSTVTPQSQLGATFEDLNGGGVNCHMARAFDHVPALAVTKLAANDGTVLFEGIRHGVLAAYDISTKKLARLSRAEIGRLVENLLPKERWKVDRETGEPSLERTIARIGGSRAYRHKCAHIMREEASFRRAQDVATSALCKNRDKLAQAISNARSGDPGRTVSIDLTSIGLLTPDFLRQTISRGGSRAMNEGQMLKDQMLAWSKLSGDPQPKTLTVRDENGEAVEVKVNIRVNAFDFGVNGFSFNKTGGSVMNALRDAVTGWNVCDDHNRQAMRGLIGRSSERADGGFGGQVGAWLESAPRDTPEQRQRISHVTELAAQIAQLWESQDYRRAGVEPYKMVSRIAVLVSMMGDDVCWNCKSGKDRTGELDVSAKHLAAQIWLTGRVPEPDHERAAEEKWNYFRLATEGGNFEFQSYNTGAPGFKLGGVRALEDEMLVDPNDPHYKRFQGIAGYYGT